MPGQRREPQNLETGHVSLPQPGLRVPCFIWTMSCLAQWHTLRLLEVVLELWERMISSSVDERFPQVGVKLSGIHRLSGKITGCHSPFMG